MLSQGLTSMEGLLLFATRQLPYPTPTWLFCTTTLVPSGWEAAAHNQSLASGFPVESQPGCAGEAAPAPPQRILTGNQMAPDIFSTSNPTLKLPQGATSLFPLAT